MADEHISDILEGAPDNWGKWGEADELGAVNYLTSEQVLRGVDAVEDGDTFALGLPVARPEGDPVWPGRAETHHYMDRDEGHYESGKFPDRGGVRAADDVVHMPLHGTTHVDAPGHVWYDDELYNGFDPETTMGGLDRGSIAGVGDHGILGRGVLLDVARHRGVDALDRGERITLDELQECADAQGVDLQERDVPLVRTGWLENYYDEEGEDIYDGPFREPGLTYSEAVVEWFHDMEIPAFGTDTIANEQTLSDETGTPIPLHPALLRNQGVLFVEMLKLDAFAEACAADGRWAFLFVASPLKVVRGTGSPVNPLAVR
ncbi:MAG: cyclase family protein [Halorientalis sp.]